MNRHNVNWDCYQAFLSVLETGSFSAAARALGMAQPTIRHRIDLLEASVGSSLFVRTAAGVHPTDQARSLAEPARRMAFASHHFQRIATGTPGQISGAVRLSAPEAIGIEVLPPLLAPLLAEHPGLSIQLSLTNASADLLNLEADIAIRMVPSTQGALQVQHVGHIALGFFAAPAYAAAHPLPTTLADLADHALIGPDRSPADLDLVRQLEAAAGHQGRFVLRTDNHLAQLAAARAGIGIAVLNVPVGQRDLIRVLPEVTLAQPDIWIVTHEDIRQNPRIDIVFRHLSAAFARQFA